jgi:HD-GYP domain-containing protein (c-di-GMP phosphodiesterase class II)
MKHKLEMKKIITCAADFCNQEPTVLFLLRRLRSFDKYLYTQAVRSAYISMELAKGLKLAEHERNMIYRSALLQDVGKIQQDHTQFLNHPILSVELLQSLIADGLVDGDAILEHHENLDGTGYPRGLTWENISLNGRILRIADSFAGMLSFDRRSGEVNETALAMEELYRWGDMMYDSDLVELLAFYYSPAAVQSNKNGVMNYL